MVEFLEQLRNGFSIWQQGKEIRMQSEEFKSQTKEFEAQKQALQAQLIENSFSNARPLRNPLLSRLKS